MQVGIGVAAFAAVHTMDDTLDAKGVRVTAHM